MNEYIDDSGKMHALGSGDNTLGKLVKGIILATLVIVGCIMYTQLVGCSGAIMLPLETNSDEIAIVYTRPLTYYTLDPMFNYSIPLVERVYIYSTEVIVNRPPTPPVIIDKHPGNWEWVDNENKKTRERIVEDDKRAPKRDVMNSKKKRKEKERDDEDQGRNRDKRQR